LVKQGGQPAACEELEAKSCSRPGHSYPQVLRDKVLTSVDGGMAVREVAQTFGVSKSYVYQAVARRRITGERGVRRGGGRRPRKLSAAQEAAFLAHLRSRPNTTVSQAKDWLLAKHGVRISTGATWNTMKRLTSSLETVSTR
jgi:transposase